MNPAVPACGVPTARAPLPPWAEGLHCSSSSIRRGAELPLGTATAAPGLHLARGNTRGEPEEDDTPSLHLKLPRDALIFATPDSHYGSPGRGAGPGSAQAPVGRCLSQGQIGNSPPWLCTRDWRLGLRGEGQPHRVTPCPLNKPHGAELVPSPPRATGASARRTVTVLACTVLMYQKTL